MLDESYRACFMPHESACQLYVHVSVLCRTCCTRLSVSHCLGHVVYVSVLAPGLLSLSDVSAHSL